MNSFTSLDLIAIGWFCFCAFAYSWFSERGPKSKTSLTANMNRHREIWMRVAARRDVRIVDTSVLAGLQNGTAFFASAALLGIGGCFALLRSADEIFQVFQDLSISRTEDQTLWEFKIFGLMLIFAYAFFKFSWSYRLWNYANILLGGIPLAEDPHDDEKEAAVQRAVAMNRIAGRQFNRGLRTFYFSLGFIGWFIGPVAFVIATTWILIVLYLRQFHSKPRDASAIGLSDEDQDS